MTEEIYVCTDCDWEGKWGRLNQSDEGRFVVCPECDAGVTIEEV